MTGAAKSAASASAAAENSVASVASSCAAASAAPCQSSIRRETTRTVLGAGELVEVVEFLFEAGGFQPQFAAHSRLSQRHRAREPHLGFSQRPAGQLRRLRLRSRESRHPSLELTHSEELALPNLILAINNR